MSCCEAYVHKYFLVRITHDHWGTRPSASLTDGPIRLLLICEQCGDVKEVKVPS